MGKSIPISKFPSRNRARNEEIVVNSVKTVDFLKLNLGLILLSISKVFKMSITKITISIPEKSSVEIAH